MKGSPPAPTAAEQAQPVAWLYKALPLHEEPWQASTRYEQIKDAHQVQPLYATPVPEQAQPAGVTEDARLDAWSVERHGFQNQLWFTRKEVLSILAARAQEGEKP